jgi:hypothetical protein
MPAGRPKGAKSRKTLERERAARIAAARAELAKNSPPIDYAASFDSLDVMEKIMRHFYLRAVIEELRSMICSAKFRTNCVSSAR